ncbi:hypothetical protein [Pelagibius sp. Alg239-R121]|uniref:hypothetical protein n=1 Tax=Pelagibius sp. Alg239-R121 TaxID=2993448 RepID=UPI0024A74029|nr:hypothetical protein [Pelagibius sp. Alg239-R121]
MFSFFAEMFGKSREVRSLERHLSQRGVNPRAVNDATKFTINKWIRETMVTVEASNDPEERNRQRADLQISAADLLAFCVLGNEDFIEANSAELARSQYSRITAATEGSNDFDAGIVMLTIHAGIAHPEIAESVEIESE